MGNRMHLVGAATLVVAVLLTVLARPDAADARGSSVSIRDAQAREGGSLAFVVQLGRKTRKPVYVDYTTVEGTADDSGDYVARSGTLRFAPGRTKRVLKVSLNTDGSDEPLEDLTIALSNPRRAKLGRDTATGTITDADGPPSLSVADASGTEGGNAIFAVALSVASGFAVSAALSSTDDSAVAGSDYEAASSTVVFAPGEATRSVEVPLLDDAVVEENETFAVELTDPTNATLAKHSATGTIIDDDLPTPSASIADAETVEGDAGSTRTVSFPVTLDMPAPREVAIDYATAPATGTSVQDFTSTNGTVVFTTGQRERSIDVQVHGDDLDEAEAETFVVRLSAPRNAGLADAEAVGTIHDDDDAPTLTINDIVDREPRRGTQSFAFTVTLSAPSGRDVSASFATKDGSAKAPADYVRTAGTVSFAPGETTRTIYIPVRGDTVGESRETFYVELSAPQHTTIVKAVGAGKIRDADD